jgi:type IV pilus assembly protein PilX
VHRRDQRGVTLIVTLIFLMVLTMLGLSAARNSVMQEHMSGSTRSRELALQAAEAALKDAEQTMGSWRTLAFDGSQPGLNTYVATQPNDAAFWQDGANWASFRAPVSSLNQVAEQPRYRIEKMPNVGTDERYRVTARGVGREAAAVVVVQAMYSYTP